MTFTDLLPPYSPRVWKAIIAGVGVLVLIGAVLLISDSLTGWWSTRSINKAKANVNAALTAANAQKSVVANDKVDEALAINAVNRAVADAVAASEASEAQKWAVEQALAEYERRRAAGLPTGTTESELLEKLEGLE